MKQLLATTPQKFLTMLSRPEKLFVISAAVFGLIMLVVMPPLMVPDENAHFYRAYQISSGSIFAVTEHKITGSILPTDLLTDVNGLVFTSINGGKATRILYHHYLVTKINTHKKSFIQFDTTSVYSPIAYIPQVIGITIGRIIYPSFLVMLYLGRFFNLLAFIAMVYLAIRLTPIGKWVFVVVGLFPMTLQQAASLSSDVMTIGIAFIAIAYALKLYCERKPLNRNQVLLIILIGAGLGLTKQTNAILILPFLFLPKLVLGKTAKMRLLRITYILSATLGLMLVWYALIHIKHYNLDYSGDPSVNLAAQTKYLAHNPFGFIRILARSFIYNGSKVPPSPDFYWQSIVGVFSWISYQLPLFNVIACYLIFGLSLLQTSELAAKFRFNLKTKTVYMATLIISVVAIAGILYIIWTPLRSPVVAGIQGRYFLPLLPLLIPVFASTKFKLTFKKPAYLGGTILVVTTINFLAMAFLTMRYFNLG